MLGFLLALGGAVLAGLAVPLAAVAQTQTGLTERQARAAVVPYVRAATDCIAKQMGEDPRFATFVREARTMDLLPEAITRCRPAVRTMIEMHDRYYGFGFGEQFARGAYLDDLPRAVGTRLKDQIAAVVARDAAEAESRITHVTAAKERKTNAYNELWNCLEAKTHALVSSGERAELIADAAVILCASEMDRFVDAAITLDSLQGLAPKSIPEVKQELTSLIQKQAVSLAVVIKSKAASSAPAPSQAPSRKATKETSSVSTCVEEMARTVRSKFADQEAKLTSILDLCRPEIEAAARAAFVASEDTLDEERQKAFVQAKSMAERALAR